MQSLSPLCIHVSQMFRQVVCCCRVFYQAEALWGFLGVSAQQMYSVLSCPSGYLVVGYQASAFTGGINYLDVSLSNLVPFANENYPLPLRKML